MSDGQRPSGQDPSTKRAVGYVALAAFLCLSVVLGAVGWFGSDRPLTLAFIYVTAPIGAVYLLVLAVNELRGRRED